MTAIFLYNVVLLVGAYRKKRVKPGIIKVRDCPQHITIRIHIKAGAACQLVQYQNYESSFLFSVFCWLSLFIKDYLCFSSYSFHHIPCIVDILGGGGKPKLTMAPGCFLFLCIPLFQQFNLRDFTNNSCSLGYILKGGLVVGLTSYYLCRSLSRR